MLRRLQTRIAELEAAQRMQREAALQEACALLEERVAERTRQLTAEIEERRRAEQEVLAAKEQAELANRSKSDFVANMSHELRTPLNAIIGFSDMMRNEVLGPINHPQYAEYINAIWESGEHLLQIINDILDLAKVEAGKFELHLEESDPRAIIDSALRLLAGRAIQGRITLTAEVADDVGRQQLDPLRFKQILLNLISNAVKFTPAGGSVTVRARREGEWLVVAVTDTGIGIAPAHIARVLEPFGQVDSKLTRRYAGTGLGLPLTKRFVELHGGTLGIESELGKGTTITVRLPVDGAAEAAKGL